MSSAATSRSGPWVWFEPGERWCPLSDRPRRGPPTAWRSISLSSPIVPNWVRSCGGCGTGACGRTSAASRPSTMPSPPSTRPSDARGRRSSAFVREDSGDQAGHRPSRRADLGEGGEGLHQAAAQAAWRWRRSVGNVYRVRFGLGGEVFLSHGDHYCHRHRDTRGDGERDEDDCERAEAREAFPVQLAVDGDRLSVDGERDLPGEHLVWMMRICCDNGRPLLGHPVNSMVVPG